MSIKLVPDLGGPLTTIAVDLVTETYAPDYNEWAAYILAVGGYVAAFMNWGGDYVKNIGISSFPWAGKKVYERVRGGAGATKLAARRVSRYPAAAPNVEFRGVKLV